jgi:hypothetical protein
MKYGKFQVKKPSQPKGNSAYTLYENGVPVTNMCFYTYKAACKFFKKHMGIVEPIEQSATPVIEKEWTVGNCSGIDWNKF